MCETTNQINQYGSDHFKIGQSFKWLEEDGIPSGKRLHNYGKSPCFMGKATISMAIFNSYVC